MAKNLIVVATDWKASDWVIANTKVQDAILLNSKNPLHDARMHAMLMYRTPESFTMKFNRTKNDSLGIFNIESWLLYHGKKLEERFKLNAYKQLNYILSSIDFTLKEDQETVRQLREIKHTVNHQVIRSIHGHDAFLIEYDQLDDFMYPIFEV